MSERLQLVFLRKNYQVAFEEIENYPDVMYLSLNDIPYPIRDIERNLFDFPSTNGLYTMYGIIDGKRRRLYVATDSFKYKYMNDEPINTMTSNPNIFYRGKHVNIKTFVNKQLTRALIPSEFNDVHRNVETYDDIVRRDLESLSVIELKTILSNKGRTHSNMNKFKLIEKTLNTLKND